MKTSALIAILMAGVTVLSAANIFPSEKTRCRELAKAPTAMAVDARVSQDLMSGIWTSADESTFEFSENGMLAIFSKNKKATVSNWVMKINDGRPVLIISKNKTDVKSFIVEQTCEGVNLTDLTNHDVLFLDFVPLPMPGYSKGVKKYLPGEWTNVTFFESENKCTNGEGGYLNYHFGKNGKYSCEYGSAVNNEIESGKWMVSKDEQFLILTNNDNGVKVVKVAQVDGHGLILEQAMETDEIGDFFCSKQTTFTFIK